jgi:hypothetical protein
MKNNSSHTNAIKNRNSGLVYPAIFILLLLTIAQSVYSQDTISEKKNRKNTVKLNLTSPMLFGDNNYVLGYERTIGKHQSFSVHVGTFSLGKLVSIDADSLSEVKSDDKSRGLSLSGDYRFYLSKVNKFNSPRGVYIGPYFSYNNFNRTYSFESTAASYPAQLNADFTFSVTTLGFQLGYQFVFWDRVSLDLILFGPGVSAYKLKAELDTNLTQDQEEELFTKINEKLQEKIPGYSLVIKPGSFEKSGSVNTTSAGYRYIVMVGFRF